MHDHPLRLPLAVAGAVAGAGLVLPDPANVTAFIAALGIGIGIGLAAIIERVGRAKAAAYREWDEAHRGSSLAQLEEAARRHEETVDQIEMNSRQLQALQGELDAERHMNEKLRDDLQGFALRVLQEKGYIAVPAEVLAPAPKDPPR